MEDIEINIKIFKIYIEKYYFKKINNTIPN